MKRVIEIDKEMYNEIKENGIPGYPQERNTTVKAIANSEPLNDVLDKIIHEINTRRKYMSFTTCRDCIDIIEAYKESEAENA